VNSEKCPFCKSEIDKTDGENVEELMKRMEANDACAIYLLGSYYTHGQLGLQQDLAKGVELLTQAAKLGSSQAHYHLGNKHRQRGDLKKAKFHYGAAAMAGYETARFNLGLNGVFIWKRGTSY
jgi:TPR repeat protein